MDGTAAQEWLSRATRRGNAAIALIRCGEGQLLQRKTEGYPYHVMVGGLNLFGGNKEADDASARETLLRELEEELPVAWFEQIRATLRPFSR
jgi:8-oxo-dGTP pyrophosphatase MutT (NUDIX family)